MAVHEKQKPSKDAPFYATGGEWTFFDCQASSHLKLAFTVGASSKSGAGNGPSPWGKAILIVEDREAGARFVELFSKAFAGKMPTPVNQAYVPGTLSINSAILGDNPNREKRVVFLVSEANGPQRSGFSNAMVCPMRSFLTTTSHTGMANSARKAATMRMTLWPSSPRLSGTVLGPNAPPKMTQT